MTSYISMVQNSSARMVAGAVSAAAALLLLLPAGKAEAQVNFAVEGRASVTAPMGDLSDAGAETGLGLGAEVTLSDTAGGAAELPDGFPALNSNL